MRRKLRWWQITLIVLGSLVALSVIAFTIFISMGYSADSVALAAMRSTDKVKVTETSYGYFFDGPSEEYALVFYPGARVEPESYAPLLQALAEAGVDVHIPRMPFNLALDIDVAEDIMSMYSYDHWFIGGHSMGGAMAARYVAGAGENTNIEAVVCFAAYASNKLPETVTEIVLIGSNDEVCKFSKIEANRDNAPSSYVEHIIEGGNHSQFGSYGHQRGDGDATITAAQQIGESVDVILECLIEVE